ncbi:MAG: putative bifunctional diguanylate cyclase/phosphodiesterase [Burkholderiaceae bacterium]
MAWANGSAIQLWGAKSLADLCGRDFALNMSESVEQRLAQYEHDFLTHQLGFKEQWTIYPQGKPISLSVNLKGYELPNGNMGMFVEAHSAVEKTPEAIRSVDALLHTAAMISLFTEDGQALYRNPAARQSVGDSHESFADRFVDASSIDQFLGEVVSRGAATQTLAVRTANGNRWHEVSARYCRDPLTGDNALLISEIDVSSIKRTEAHANHMASHDSLTGLPNRTHVIDYFRDAIDHIWEQKQEAALVLIDLDHFKDVNDSLGHQAGDRLLVAIAQRLLNTVRSQDLVARLGGDEFLILMFGHGLRAEIDRLKTRLMLAVSEPVLVDGQEVYVTPSLGVSLLPDDSQDLESMMRNADLAMYRAKERGRNELAYYDADMSTALRERRQLEIEVRRAFENNEFEVYYQPIVETTSGRITGAEALVRWNHPVRGLVLPNEFVSVCEQTSMIDLLGRFVFEQAVRQQATWKHHGLDLRMSINLSARQLQQVDLFDYMTETVRIVGARADSIQLEITESMLLGHDVGLLELLNLLQSVGFSIALDDFGTGYSNLAYLQRFPIEILKIDRTFIQGIDTSETLAEMIVSLCGVLELGVVAEGVETLEQLAWVRDHGVERCQGYLFSRPLSADAFAELARGLGRLSGIRPVEMK